MQLLLELPLPPAQLSPNARPHWRAKAKAVRGYRQTAAALCRVAMARQHVVGGWTEATCRAYWYHRDRRRRDRDNLQASLKAAFDGLADAGLLLDDVGLTHLPPVLRVDRERPHVLLEISENTSPESETDLV